MNFTLIGAITVPAKTSVPKLIVQRGEDLPVLRLYFAKGDIKPLPAPIADPADPTGAVARVGVPAQRDTFYALGNFDVRLTGVKPQTEAIGEYEAGESEQFVVATIAMRNATRQPQSLNWSILDSDLKTADGESVERLRLIKAARPDNIEGEVGPGAEYSARLFYKIPKDASPKTLAIWEEENGRRFSFDVSGAK